MRSIVYALVLALSASAGASAAGLKNARVFQNFGPKDYEGTDFSATFKAPFAWMTPRFQRYSSQGSGGSVGAAQLEIGVEQSAFGFGLHGGTVFKKSGYSAIYGGGEMAFRLSSSGSGGSRLLSGGGASAPTGKGLGRLDLGVGASALRHKSEATTALAEATLSQFEVYGFGRASIVGFELFARAGAHAYDDEPKDKTRLPSTIWTPVWGHARLTNGFPKGSFHLRGSMPFFPLVTPYADVTYTTYKELAGGLKPGDTKAFSVGAAVGLELLAVEAQYQVLKTNGGSSDSFIGVGAQLRL